ncbi:hypothetical protein FNV58_00820 (plasmid) [Streptomyces sp. RLB1-9]|uniref:hypothetical protein n=1 Tax=Streptomyces sp. RLB1-9 TaxID=2594454 RepID=UPI001164FD45|nr:hypothetical protein [Streptomyces sp. RLB1-9]QDN94903.1 hypothetical protein FNV58_00820 [Streptomyces sp. RLB1-9]
MTENLRQRDGDQPLPTEGQENVQDALIERIKERRALGIQRYGRPLQTFNGRNAVRDALEEALDLSTYLMQVEMEQKAVQARIRHALTLHVSGLSGLCLTCKSAAPCATREALTSSRPALKVTIIEPSEELVCSPDAVEEIRRQFGVTEEQTGLTGIGSLMGFPVFVDDELPPGTVRLQPSTPKK